MTNTEKVLSLSHLSKSQISREVNISRYHVSMILRANGFKQQSIETMKAKILSLRDKPVSEIKRQVNTDARYIRRILKKYYQSEFFTHDPYYNF